MGIYLKLAYGRGMYLRRAIVVLGASFPHAKVWGTIGTLHIIHKILYKGHFIMCVDNLQSRCNHLHQEQQIKRDLKGKREVNNLNLTHALSTYAVDLQVIVELIRIDLLASVQMEFAVQRVLIRLTLLEELHSRRLLHPTLEYAAHALHCALAQLV